jgi:hypothetical protein
VRVALPGVWEFRELLKICSLAVETYSHISYPGMSKAINMAKKSDQGLVSKLKAIETIVNVLQELDEEARGDVVSFALRQVGMASVSSGESKTVIQPPSNYGNSSVDGSMDKFVKVKNPQNEYQRVAVIAYYLEHKQGKKEFKNAEMSLANTNEARQPKISNITDVVNKATLRYKFLTKGTGKATHQLSTHGSDVVEALPNHERVTELIAAAKKGKPKKKKKAK